MGLGRFGRPSADACETTAEGQDAGDDDAEEDDLQTAPRPLEKGRDLWLEFGEVFRTLGRSVRLICAFQMVFRVRH